MMYMFAWVHAYVSAFYDEFDICDVFAKEICAKGNALPFEVREPKKICLYLRII